MDASNQTMGQSPDVIAKQIRTIIESTDNGQFRYETNQIYANALSKVFKERTNIHQSRMLSLSGGTLWTENETIEKENGTVEKDKELSNKKTELLKSKTELTERKTKRTIKRKKLGANTVRYRAKQVIFGVLSFLQLPINLGKSYGKVLSWCASISV